VVTVVALEVVVTLAAGFVGLSTIDLPARNAPPASTTPATTTPPTFIEFVATHRS